MGVLIYLYRCSLLEKFRREIRECRMTLTQNHEFVTFSIKIWFNDSSDSKKKITRISAKKFLMNYGILTRYRYIFLSIFRCKNFRRNDDY